MYTTSQPIRLSVVIAAWNGSAALHRCIRSLQNDRDLRPTELIAVTNFELEEGRAPEDDRFCFRHIAMPSGTPVPFLRSTGVLASQGEIVALTEDNCEFAPNWHSELMKAHASPSRAVIGGSVDQAGTGSALDWAVYFYDYSRFAPDGSMRPVETLSGVNVSYKREVIRQIEPVLTNGLIEPFTHAEIINRGFGLYFAPAVLVFHNKRHQGSETVAKCYHLARGYAAERALKLPNFRKVAFVARSPLLPFLLLARAARSACGRFSRFVQFVRSLPWLICLTASWSAGELFGYIGGPGQSASKWS